MNAQHCDGFVVWITNMSRTGKSFLAEYLRRRLDFVGRTVEVLDGDLPDSVLTEGLGASKEDRDAACRRVGWVAKLLARNGVAVLCTSLSPHREIRDAIRRDVRRFVEVFVDCELGEFSIYREPGSMSVCGAG